MCNCGKNRNSLTQPLSGQVVAKSRTSGIWQDTDFEYTGKSGLTVIGPVTGQRYRFNYPGDRQLIDYRDASAMAGVPNLKKIKIEAY